MVETIPAVGGRTVADTPEVDSGHTMGETAPARNSLSTTSERKDSALSPEKQASDSESSEIFTITPTKHTRKSGKTTDVFLVKFKRELTEEEKKGADAFMGGEEAARIQP